MSDITANIQDAVSLSVQDKTGSQGGIFLVNWMARAGATVPAWWSMSRDIKLREFWKTSDHLSGAVYTMQSKMTAIPCKVVARDTSVREHVIQAEQVTRTLLGASEFGEGWPIFFGKFVEDLLTMDNGCFAEIIGAGRPDGPILGMPVGVAHLDSVRCQRTGDQEFPILYHDRSGKIYKLHYTRVMALSQMTSPIADMFGVGFCAVSRSINVAQTLIDILVFKQEKLGSRPHRAFIVTQGGLDPEDIALAMERSEASMDAQGMSRYSKMVVTGSASMENADMKVIEFSSMPDGFDEETSITLGMATIALAFGVDARELFPAMTAGATRADALLQHIKQRGKGPGQIIQSVEQLFNYKFLPQHLEFVFDFQDDAQDRQIAEIRKIRAERRRQEQAAKLVSNRVLREQMLVDGDITRQQFERLELESGRLADGTSVLALFLSKDPSYKRLLDLGTPDPLDIDAQNKDAMLRLIRERIVEINEKLVNASGAELKRILFSAFMALKHLEKAYDEENLSLFTTADDDLDMPDEDEEEIAPPTRIRKRSKVTPNEGRETSTSTTSTTRASPDDRVD